MNERSSRAHALFILSLAQSRDAPPGARLDSTLGSDSAVQLKNRLFLADLGGASPPRNHHVNHHH